VVVVREGEADGRLIDGWAAGSDDGACRAAREINGGRATVRIAVRTCADVAHPASSFTDDDRQFATLSVHRCRRVHPPSIGTSSASSVI